MSTMLPAASDGIYADIVDNDAASKTYKVGFDYEGMTNFNGYRYDLDAMRQAIYKIIHTERYQFLIYSWNYGIELEDLFGKPVPYIYAELPRRIKEALLADDRITDVDNFQLSHDKKGNVLCKFDAKTVYGTVSAQREVQTSV